MPTIAIFGATGLQGGSVLTSVLSSPFLTPIAITRNSSSPAAQALTEKGIRVVQAHLSDLKSLENAVDGADAVFGMTNAWDPEVAADHTLEARQGRNIVEACQKKGVKFLIWSSTPSYDKDSNGKYSNVHHCNNKYKTDEVLHAQSVVDYAILHTSWFPENLYRIGYIRPVPDNKDKYTLTIPAWSHPDAQQVMTHGGKEIGPSALAILNAYFAGGKAKEDVVGKTFPVAGVKISFAEFTRKLADATGKEIQFFNPPTCGVNEIDEMYKFQSDGFVFPNRTLPDPWLVAHGAKFSTVDDIVADVAAHAFKET